MMHRCGNRNACEIYVKDKGNEFWRGYADLDTKIHCITRLSLILFSRN